MRWEEGVRGRREHSFHNHDEKDPDISHSPFSSRAQFKQERRKLLSLSCEVDESIASSANNACVCFPPSHSLREERNGSCWSLTHPCSSCRQLELFKHIQRMDNSKMESNKKIANEVFHLYVFHLTPSDRITL